MSSTNLGSGAGIRHTSHSRGRNSSPYPYLQPESLVLPDGAVGEEVAELLEELVFPHNETRQSQADAAQALSDPHDEEDEAHEAELLVRASLPWWKRPSPVWLLVAVLFSSMAVSFTLAPRIAIYTNLACRVYRPEYAYDSTLPRVMDLSAPDGKNKCASDPVVQAAVAKLTAFLITTVGVLSCITTAWWGSRSDRYGRINVIGFSMLGLLSSELNFIFVFYFADYLPGNYWFLMVSALVEGTFGGMASGVAATHAYLADCTNPSTRSRIFSTSLGLLFSGVALGPAIGGYVIRITGQTISAFWLAAGLHLIYGFMVWFVVPESLTKARMLAARAEREEKLRKEREAASGAPAEATIVRITKSLLSVFSPLATLLPAKVESDNPLKIPKRDYSLFCIAVSYSLAISVMGAATYKFQYATAVFDWSPEVLSYYLGLVGLSRAIFLAAVLPFIIHLLKSRYAPIRLPTETQEPLQSSATSPSRKPALSAVEQKSSSAFDIGVARVSLIIDLVAYILMGITSSPVAYTLYTMLASLGTGFSPAAQSIALDLHGHMQGRRKGGEAGKLFGAMSVLQALGSQILGPAIYGFTYYNTVATQPNAIFLLSVVSVAIAFILLAFVRLPSDSDTVPDPEIAMGDPSNLSTELEADRSASSQGPIAVTRQETLVAIEPTNQPEPTIST